MDEEHVKSRATADAEKHAVPPFMKKNDERNGDEFRQGMIGRKHGVLQAIDDEQANCCRRQYRAQIGNEGRRIVFGKDRLIVK